MFSEEYYNEIKAAFDGQMKLLDERRLELERGGEKPDTGKLSLLSGRLLQDKKREIEEAFRQCTKEETEALTFLYSAMPLSDLLDYPAGLFLTYARHGVFLWKQGDFAGRVPERIFANYVLHYRVNNEDIADTRGFFYDKLKESLGEITSSKSMYETAIDVNYWCAGEATYRSTDGRTQNARTMYGAAIGRCGEESTFAVTALRSIGIPARQIYAPLWTHCDDNHAWVELWCDGEWYFLGACEPEERLNRGWFIGPASRAVMLHSRWFGKDEPLERQVGPKGMAKVLNHMERYAHTTELTIHVKDENGKSVPGARVDFQVLNHGCFGTVAIVNTGSEGRAKLITGFGDLHVSVSADCGNNVFLYGEKMIYLSNSDSKTEKEFEIILKEQPEATEDWLELDIHAPETGHIHDGELTKEQETEGERRLSMAAQYRQNKAESFYQAREAERVLNRFRGEDRAMAEEILHRARGNMGEIVRFLEWDAGLFLPGNWQAGKNDCWKLELLNALREKDCWDIKAEVLTDCCINALPFAGTVPDEVFYRFLVCPRVSDEMLRPCRMVLEQCLGEDGKAAVRREPDCLLTLVENWIVSIPEQEYEDLITTPLGCVRGGVGSRHSKNVLCVNLYRSMGIPARLSFFDNRIEYWQDGKFVTAGRTETEDAVLTLCEDDSIKLSEWEHYSLERFEGTGFRRVGLWREMSHVENGELKLSVRPGIYRIVTTNRKKNGDQAARMTVFSLTEGERRREVLSLRDVSEEDASYKGRVEDFALHTREGKEELLSVLAGEGRALFLWLAVTREPTEHILNELYDKREDFAGLKTPIYAVLKTEEDLKNSTLRRTLEALPGICTVFDEFGENYKTLAASVGQEPGRLPLSLILEGGRECVYSDAGYNVGLGDLLYRMLV